jgi:hypothetical protein
MIPFPRVGRRQSAADPTFIPIVQPDFLNGVNYIWSKFNFNNGVNLSGFRHNLRNYYNDAEAITSYELEWIRRLLSDPDLHICFSPVGKSFQWDNRITPSERKCIFIDEAFFFLFNVNQTDSQTNAFRLIFMATLIHCLGDYITSWAQPNIDFSLTTQSNRFEGGTKTEYAFFSGIIGGHMTDGIRYDCAKIRLFNSSNQEEHWIIPDHIARDIYNSDHIPRLTEAGLTRFTLITGPTTTVRQLEFCCGRNRLVWKPIHRHSQDPQQSGYGLHGYYHHQPPTSHWYPLPPQSQPPQSGGFSYPAAPGTTYMPPPQCPPPAATFGSGHICQFHRL